MTVSLRANAFFCGLAVVALVSSGLFGCDEQGFAPNEAEGSVITQGQLPVPEYDASQAIVLHVRGVESFAQSPIGSKPLLAELVATFPKVVIVDDQPTTECQTARAQVQQLLSQSGFDRTRLSVLRTPTVGDAGRFIRDWIGVPTSDGKTTEVMNFRYFQPGDVTQDMVLKVLGLRARPSDKFFEGGNFTADGKGNCFLGEGGASPVRLASFQKIDQELLRLGCKSATYLPSMSRRGEEGFYTSVNHIDLWMRLISDDVAAVATIDSESLQVFEKSPSAFLAPFSTSPVTGDMIAKKKASIADLQSKLDSGARLLEKAGKRIVRIPHPVPVGNVLEPFLNAVQSGKQLLLSGRPPVRENIGGVRPDILDAVKQRAIAALNKEGFTAKFIDASPLLGGGGALHCASANLPARLFK
jgi:hypothetical protein